MNSQNGKLENWLVQYTRLDPLIVMDRELCLNGNQMTFIVGPTFTSADIPFDSILRIFHGSPFYAYIIKVGFCFTT